MTNKIQITEANKYNTTDIAKWIRQTFKAVYPDIKFSVRTSLYAGGSSIAVTILENNRTRILKTFDEVTPQEICSVMSGRGDNEEEAKAFIKQQINSEYHQVNQFHIDSSWHWTEEGKKLLTEIMGIIDKYNHDNSDSMTDYFDVNYYVDFNLGDYDKPYVEVAK